MSLRVNPGKNTCKMVLLERGGRGRKEGRKEGRRGEVDGTMPVLSQSSPASACVWE